MLPYNAIIFEKAEKQLEVNAGSACVILYHSVIEALFNDIVGLYECMDKHKPQQRGSGGEFLGYLYLKKDSHEFETMRKLRDIEMKNIHSKINELIQIRSKFLTLDEEEIVNEVKNQRWHQEMSLLIKTRNALVHPKAIYLTMNKDTQEISGFNKFINDHVNKKRIQPVNFGDCWIDNLDTPEFCNWCKETTYNAIDGIKKLLIESKFNNYLLNFLKIRL